MYDFSDYLWRDYLLYDYFKAKMVKDIKSFGINQLEDKKKNLNRVAVQMKGRCKSDSKTYYKRKTERGDSKLLNMENLACIQLKDCEKNCAGYLINKLRKIQEARSLKVLKDYNIQKGQHNKSNIKA